jgi:hypothetical protein
MSEPTDEEPNLVRLEVDGPMAVMTNFRAEKHGYAEKKAARAEARPPVYRKR